MIIQQTHVYSAQAQGCEYVLDVVMDQETGEQLYMTGWRNGVHRLDYILFEENLSSKRYQIEQIDYYCKQSNLWRHGANLWIALLVHCPESDLP